MLMTCCAYSCTRYGLHTQYMLLTHADDLLCLQLHTVQSPYTVHAADPCWWLAVPTAAHSTVCTHSTCCWPMLMTCCAYSCTQYGLHTQHMLLTHADDLLCLQLHTVRSAHTVHASNPCWWLAVPTAAHSTVCIHSTCCWPMLMTCCAYSCTQYGLYTHTIHASNPCWWLPVPTAAHSTVCTHSTCF